MSSEARNPGNEKPISLYPLTPEQALGGLMNSRPEQKGQQVQIFHPGDRVALSRSAKTLPREIRGKQGVVLESWERFREQTDEPRYFLYVVELDDTERHVEVAEADLTSV